jgi:uncharacterized phosphosugar-binding protein
MTASLDYLKAVRGILDFYEKNPQTEAVEKASDLVADSVLKGGIVHLAAVGHSNEQDFINRAGGPAFLQPFTFSVSIQDPGPDCLKSRPRPEPFDREIETIRFAVKAANLRAGDVLAVGSVSGRNVRPVELALACRERGIKVIGFTSLAYTAKVTSAHPSGKKLADVADVVVDNGAPYGDAAVAIPGYDFALMPVSGVSMTVGGWLIWGRALEKMAARGTPASVFMSVNRPDGQAVYDTNKARYQKLGY